MTAAKKTAPRPSSKAAARPASTKRQAKPAKVGFVSLGCPKALVDSERILTELRAEGYVVAPSYADADLVVVNTCGFIDAAVQESLDAIGEALAENGFVAEEAANGTEALGKVRVSQGHYHAVVIDCDLSGDVEVGETLANEIRALYEIGRAHV